MPAFSARGTYESALKRLKIKHRSFHLAMLLPPLYSRVLALFGPLMAIVNTVSVPLRPRQYRPHRLLYSLGIFEGYKFLTQRK